MIDFENVPDWWALCPYDDCPKAGECLRHRACKEAPKQFSQWACVLPHVRKEDGCRYFQKDEKVRMVRGLKALFEQIKDKRIRADVRSELVAHFGSNGTYYRYRDGKRWLNPDWQEMIQNVLKRNGVSGEAQYDESVLTYDFTTIPEAD